MAEFRQLSYSPRWGFFEEEFVQHAGPSSPETPAITVQVTSVKVNHEERLYDQEVEEALVEAVEWYLEQVGDDIAERAPRDTSGFDEGDYPPSHVFQTPIHESIGTPQVDAYRGEIVGTLPIDSEHAAPVQFGALALGGSNYGFREITPRNAEALVIPLDLIRNHLRPAPLLDDDELEHRKVVIGGRTYIYSNRAYLPGQRPQNYLARSLRRYRLAFHSRARSLTARAIEAKFRDVKVEVVMTVTAA